MCSDFDDEYWTTCDTEHTFPWEFYEAMAAGGFTVYSGEWWHFDGPGAAVQRPIVDVQVV